MAKSQQFHFISNKKKYMMAIAMSILLTNDAIRVKAFRACVDKLLKKFFQRGQTRKQIATFPPFSCRRDFGSDEAGLNSTWERCTKAIEAYCKVQVWKHFSKLSMDAETLF